MARHDALGQPGLQRQLLWRGRLHHGGGWLDDAGLSIGGSESTGLPRSAVGVGGSCGQRAGQQYV